MPTDQSQTWNHWFKGPYTELTLIVRTLIIQIVSKHLKHQVSRVDTRKTRESDVLSWILSKDVVLAVQY